MNFSFLLGLSKPNDLWTILIDWIQGGIGNLGWTILLLTVFVKLVTTPLDFVSKLSQKKQTLIQQKCAPEVAKLQKKFGNDRQRLQVQTNALYKREGLKMGTSCLVMLVNMILTMVIFFTFFASLRNVSAYEAITQYEKVETSYQTAFTTDAINAYNEGKITSIDGSVINSAETVDKWAKDFSDAKTFVEANPSDTEGWAEKNTFYLQNKDAIVLITETAANAAVDTWHDVKADWLWVQNIWVSDGTTTPFPSYSELKNMSKGKYKTYVKENINEADYNAIAGLIQSNETKNNGYFILAILAGAVTLLSQFIADFHNKLKNKNANLLSSQANPQAGMSMKMMKIIMPIIMIMFVLTSSASFGIYILASNIASIVFGEIISLIVTAMTKKKQLEVEEALEKEALRLMRKGKLKG